jgi:Ca2+-binding RTX toxin-like protein
MDELGLDTTTQIGVGWSTATVGNHAQMIATDGTEHLLLDPTIAIVARGLSYPALISGTPATALTRFAFRDEGQAFADQIEFVLENGRMHISDALYHISGRDDWTNGAQQGVRLAGPADADTVVGTGWHDRISTAAGDDALYGGGGVDTLIGGIGNDTLDGGIDYDVMVGGEGADLFVFRRASDIMKDRIIDFETGVDKIDFSLIDAHRYRAGDQAFKFVEGPFTAAAQIKIMPMNYGDGVDGALSGI